MHAQSRVVAGSPALRLGLVALLLLALAIAGVTVGALLINRQPSLPSEWSGFPWRTGPRRRVDGQAGGRPRSPLAVPDGSDPHVRRAVGETILVTTPALFARSTPPRERSGGPSKPAARWAKRR